MTAPNTTPGPWTIDKVDLSDWPILGPSNGFCADIIATVHCTDLGEGEANAHLIAASPELYEALEGLERYLRDTPHHNAPEAAAARSALRKARGEA